MTQSWGRKGRMEEGESHDVAPSRAPLSSTCHRTTQGCPLPSLSLRAPSNHPRAPRGAVPQRPDIHLKTLQQTGLETTFPLHLHQHSACPPSLPPTPTSPVAAVVTAKAQRHYHPGLSFPVGALTFYGSGFRLSPFSWFLSENTFSL